MKQPTTNRQIEGPNPSVPTFKKLYQNCRRAFFLVEFGGTILKKLTQQLFEGPMSVTLAICENRPDYNNGDVIELANQLTLAVDNWETRSNIPPSLPSILAAAILWMFKIMETQFAVDEDAESAGDNIKIVKGYKVFDLRVSADEPMDEPSEMHLYGWLSSRGFPQQEAWDIIQEVDEKGEIHITLP
jgi:hypothetical protein